MIKHPEAGEAHVFVGDPRAVKDIDAWFRNVLYSSSPASSRPYLYGADAGLCARRNVLLQNNESVANEITDTANAYMAIGVAIEDMLAKALDKDGSLIKQSLRLVDMPELKISGKIDLVIFDTDGELALVEVKTCGKLPTEPKPTHLAQIQTYAAVSGIHKCWLTYISRNVELIYGEGLSIRSFLVDTDEGILTERLRIAAFSAIAAKRKKVPPIPAHFRKHTECHYCQFRDLFCWKPRPGLGGDVDSPPLPEMTGKEAAQVDTKAAALAEELWLESLDRKLRTIDSLLKLSLLDIHRSKLLDIRKELMRILTI